MNQNKQLIILENFSALFGDCIQSSEVLRDDGRPFRKGGTRTIAHCIRLDVIESR